MSLFDLSNKVAVVTGATKGIGRGTVERLAEHGARVVVSSRHQVACDKVAAELDEGYGKNGVRIAHGGACDIESLEQIEQLAERAAELFDGIDVLVANAATLPFVGPSAHTPTDLFERILTKNLHNNFRLCQAVRPHMANRGGSIVLIGSLAGLVPFPTLMAYSIAKAGLAHLARCLADEFASDGITVNCVSPGSIRSASSARSGVDEDSRRAAAVPLKRVGEPDDVAGAVIYLASAAGSYVTGVTLPVDGGRSRLSPANRGVPTGHRRLWDVDLNDASESADEALE